MRRKKSHWSKIIGILLALSLCANLIFAMLFLRLSRSTSQKMEVLAKRIEEFSMLMQERQDSMENENLEEGSMTGGNASEKSIAGGNALEKNMAEESTEEESTTVGRYKENPADETDRSGKTETEQAETKVQDLIQETEMITENYFAGPMPELVEKYISAREQNWEKWSVSFEQLAKKGEIYEYNGQEKMQSASVIKVFIMGTVYDRMCYPSSADRLIYAEESYEGELRYLLEQMITISDNNAANRLIEMLGGGDFRKGAEVVNEFCRENGYNETSVGRRFLEENPSGDNYTSAADCRKILNDIYQGTCVGEEASGKMLDILKQQTNTVKIPSGLPSGTVTANKTGEMPEGYGLGCIENDMAVVYSQKGDYILTILSNELGGRNEEAKQVIRDISAFVWQWAETQDTGA